MRNTNKSVKFDIDRFQRLSPAKKRACGQQLIQDFISGDPLLACTLADDGSVAGDHSSRLEDRLEAPIVRTPTDQERSMAKRDFMVVVSPSELQTVLPTDKFSTDTPLFDLSALEATNHTPFKGDAADIVGGVIDSICSALSVAKDKAVEIYQDLSPKQKSALIAAVAVPSSVLMGKVMLKNLGTWRLAHKVGKIGSNFDGESAGDDASANLAEQYLTSPNDVLAYAGATGEDNSTTTTTSDGSSYTVVDLPLTFLTWADELGQSYQTRRRYNQSASEALANPFYTGDPIDLVTLRTPPYFLDSDGCLIPSAAPYAVPYALSGGGFFKKLSGVASKITGAASKAVNNIAGATPWGSAIAAGLNVVSKATGVLDRLKSGHNEPQASGLVDDPSAQVLEGGTQSSVGYVYPEGSYPAQAQQVVNMAYNSVAQKGTDGGDGSAVPASSINVATLPPGWTFSSVGSEAMTGDPSFSGDFDSDTNTPLEGAPFALAPLIVSALKFIATWIATSFIWDGISDVIGKMTDSDKKDIAGEDLCPDSAIDASHSSDATTASWGKAAIEAGVGLALLFVSKGKIKGKVGSVKTPALSGIKNIFSGMKGGSSGGWSHILSSSRLSSLMSQAGSKVGGVLSSMTKMAFKHPYLAIGLSLGGAFSAFCLSRKEIQKELPDKLKTLLPNRSSEIAALQKSINGIGWIDNLFKVGDYPEAVDLATPLIMEACTIAAAAEQMGLESFSNTTWRQACQWFLKYMDDIIKNTKNGDPTAYEAVVAKAADVSKAAAALVESGSLDAGAQQIINQVNDSHAGAVSSEQRLMNELLGTGAGSTGSYDTPESKTTAGVNAAVQEVAENPDMKADLSEEDANSILNDYLSQDENGEAKIAAVLNDLTPQDNSATITNKLFKKGVPIAVAAAVALLITKFATSGAAGEMISEAAHTISSLWDATAGKLSSKFRDKSAKLYIS